MCSFSSGQIFKGLSAMLLCGLFLAQPQACADGFSQGALLCLHTLLPALFPCFVACSLLASTTTSGNSFASAVFLSWIGGYAVCAGLVRDLRIQGKISADQAQLLLLLGCCSGPGFVVGSIGGQMFGSVAVGMVLYVAQILANILCVLLYRGVLRLSCSRQDYSFSAQQIAPASGPDLSSAITQAVNSSLCVCGSVLFFRILRNVIVNALSLPAFLMPGISALLEISSGCGDFASLGGPLSLTGVCLCLSILSLSVLTQIKSLVGGTVSLSPLLLSRLVHVPLMLLLANLGFRLLPGNAEAFTSMAPRIVPMNRVSPDAAAVIFLFLCAVLYKIRKKNYNKTIHR